MEELTHTKINEEMWDKKAEIFYGNSWRCEYLRKAQKKVISLLGLRDNITMLNIGCGTGWALGQAAQAVHNNGQFYGIDLSEKMIEKAKENFKGKDNFHFTKANSESIPLQDGSFDIIICTNSFHHYLHPDRALKEMWRLLKSGGKTFILDPTADNWYLKLFDKFAGLVEQAHVKMYCSGEFKDMITGSSLKYAGAKPINWHAKVHVGEK